MSPEIPPYPSQPPHDASTVFDSSSPPSPAPPAEMFPLGTDESDALLDLDWAVEGVMLEDSVPFFRLQVGPVAMEIAGAAQLSGVAVRQVCSELKDWNTFFDAQTSSLQPLPFCRHDLVPGELLNFTPEYMMLWNKKWMVIGWLHIVLSQDDVKAQSNVRSCVLKALAAWDGAEIDGS
ncbi:hypothetical protein J7T55_011999 [Diaporthe amygdali]|uniref:uncharacterized protein n=1 Tax=Phomopsis amygdali TaxID=1214568 RepID=UPI0022FF40F7|nr:uncharacterized protein J7T55_011999 [Diaporthe amygdali]KAJ0123534.1 hypothetical protein J7T55_011999 [Diaporthe amygdali]